MGFTGGAVLRATPKFLAEVGQLHAPAGYEPLDARIPLAAGRARPLRHRRDGDSQAILESLGVGERRYMYLTRMFECGLDGRSLGYFFVEANTWLLRVHFFPDKSAYSPVEGID